jgi:hypothetical protein
LQCARYNGGRPVPKPQQSVAGRWQYTGENLKYVEQWKGVMLKFAEGMQKLIDGFHREEWHNVGKMYGSKPITLGRLVFIDWFDVYHKVEYGWSNGQAGWCLGAGARAHEMPARHLYRVELYEYAMMFWPRVLRRAGKYWSSCEVAGCTKTPLCTHKPHFDADKNCTHKPHFEAGEKAKLAEMTVAYLR